MCTVNKTPDDGQRNCPKHVEFYYKNKFEKLVHLVGYIVRIYHDVQSPERHKGFLETDPQGKRGMIVIHVSLVVKTETFKRTWTSQFLHRTRHFSA